MIPYRYSEVVNMFERVAYLVSADEIASVIEYVNKRGVKPTKTIVSNMLGVGLEIHNRTPKRSVELRRFF